MSELRKLVFSKIWSREFDSLSSWLMPQMSVNFYNLLSKDCRWVQIVMELSALKDNLENLKRNQKFYAKHKIWVVLEYLSARTWMLVTRLQVKKEAKYFVLLLYSFIWVLERYFRSLICDLRKDIGRLADPGGLMELKSPWKKTIYFRSSDLKNMKFSLISKKQMHWWDSD